MQFLSESSGWWCSWDCDDVDDDDDDDVVVSAGGNSTAEAVMGASSAAVVVLGWAVVMVGSVSFSFGKYECWMNATLHSIVHSTLSLARDTHWLLIYWGIYAKGFRIFWIRRFPHLLDPKGFRIFGSKGFFLMSVLDHGSKRFSYFCNPKGFRIFLWHPKGFLSLDFLAGDLRPSAQPQRWSSI